MLRLALIGLGHIGSTHIAALDRLDGIKLVAACDHNSNLASLLPPGLPFYTCHHELLSVGGYDTVIVATPNHTHYDIACDVLKASFNVMLEKPASESLANLKYLLELSSHFKRHIYFAFHAACGFEVDYFKNSISDHRNSYGPITGFASRFYDPYVKPSGSLSDHCKSLGNCWTDSGVNALSVLDNFLPTDKLSYLYKRRSFLTVNPYFPVSVSAGFQFASFSQLDVSGFGIIETAWDQSINHKSTTLFYGNSGWQITLDHSDQKIIAISPSQEKKLITRFEGDRLINHYIGVFSDYLHNFKINSYHLNNIASLRIHSQLFTVNA